jgi:hypothetical protein
MLLNPYRFGVAGGGAPPWSLDFNFVNAPYVPHTGGCNFDFK